MTVSRDLQTIVGRLNDAIVGRQNWGRAELEGLRRELRLISEDAQQEESRGFRTNKTLDELLLGIETDAANIIALVGRAQRQKPAPRQRAANIRVAS